MLKALINLALMIWLPLDLCVSSDFLWKWSSISVSLVSIGLEEVDSWLGGSSLSRNVSALEGVRALLRQNVNLGLLSSSRSSSNLNVVLEGNCWRLDKDNVIWNNGSWDLNLMVHNFQVISSCELYYN